MSRSESDIKNLLVRLNISTANWKAAVQDISRTLASERKKESKAQEDTKQALQRQIKDLLEAGRLQKDRNKELENQLKAQLQLNSSSDLSIKKLREELATKKETVLALQKQVQTEKLRGQTAQKQLEKELALLKESVKEEEKKSKYAAQSIRMKGEHRQFQKAGSVDVPASSQPSATVKTTDIHATVDAKTLELKKQLVLQDEKLTKAIQARDAIAKKITDEEVSTQNRRLALEKQIAKESAKVDQTKVALNNKVEQLKIVQKQIVFLEKAALVEADRKKTIDAQLRQLRRQEASFSSSVNELNKELETHKKNLAVLRNKDQSEKMRLSYTRSQLEKELALQKSITNEEEKKVKHSAQLLKNREARVTADQPVIRTTTEVSSTPKTIKASAEQQVLDIKKQQASEDTKQFSVLARKQALLKQMAESEAATAKKRLELESQIAKAKEKVASSQTSLVAATKLDKSIQTHIASLEKAAKLETDRKKNIQSQLNELLKQETRSQKNVSILKEELDERKKILATLQRQDQSVKMADAYRQAQLKRELDLIKDTAREEYRKQQSLQGKEKYRLAQEAMAAKAASGSKIPKEQAADTALIETKKQQVIQDEKLTKAIQNREAILKRIADSEEASQKRRLTLETQITKASNRVDDSKQKLEKFTEQLKAAQKNITLLEKVSSLEVGRSKEIAQQLKQAKKQEESAQKIIDKTNQELTARKEVLAKLRNQFQAEKMREVYKQAQMQRELELAKEITNVERRRVQSEQGKEAYRKTQEALARAAAGKSPNDPTPGTVSSALSTATSSAGAKLAAEKKVLEVQKQQVILEETRKRIQEAAAKKRLEQEAEYAKRRAASGFTPPPPGGPQPPAPPGTVPPSSGGGSSFLTGMLGGAAFAVVQQGLTWLIQSFGRLGTAIKNAAMEVGPLVNKLSSFENLTKRAGESNEEFLHKLQGVTDGLVDEFKLIDFANKILLRNTGVSTESVTKLTGLVTKYARVQGKDATDALQTFSTGLNRMNLSMLATRLDLDPATQALLAQTEVLEDHARAQAQVQILTDALGDQLKRTGEPVETLTDKIKRLKEQISTYYNQTIIAIERSDEFNILLQGWSGTLGIVTSAVKILWEVVTGLNDALNALAETISLGLIDVDESNIGLFKNTLITIAEITTTAAAALEMLSVRIKNLKKELSEGGSGSSKLGFLLGGPIGALLGAGFSEEATKELDEIENQWMDKIGKLEEMRKPEAERDSWLDVKGNKGTTGTDTKPDIDIKTRKEILQLQLNLERESAEKEFTIAKNLAQRKRELSESLYKYNRQTLVDYIAAQKQAAQEEYQAEYNKVQRIKSIELRTLDIEAADPKFKELTKLDPTYGQRQNLKRAEVETRANTQILQLNEKLRQDLKRLDEMALDDHLKAARTRQEAEIERLRATLDRQQAVLENEYLLGKITQDDLLRKRQILAVERQLADVATAQLRLSQTPDSETARQEYRAAVSRAGMSREEAERQIVETAAQTQRGAEQVRLSSEIELDKMRLAAKVKFNENELQNRRITINQMLDIARRQIVEEGELAKRDADLKRKFSVANVETAATYNAEIVRINEETNQKLTDFDRQRSKVVLDHTTQLFRTEMERLEASAAAGTSQSSTLQKQIDLTKKHIDFLMMSAMVNKDDVELNKEKLQQIHQLNAALTEMIAKQKQLSFAIADSASILANFFSSMDTGAEKGFSNITRQIAQGFNIGANVQGVLGSYKTSTTRINANMSENPFVGLLDTFNQLITPDTDEESKARKAGTERLKEFNEALHAVVGMVGSVYQVFQTKGGTAGAISGASTGAAIGGTFGGPIGAAIGAGVGTVVGFISGNARKKTEEAATALIKAFNKITEAFSLGELKLKETITSLTKQRQEAVDKLSGRKGGREELDKMLPQVDQQIAQLKAQQKQIAEALEKEITILAAPDAYQEYVRDLDSIIEKYKDFEGAVEDTARAQEFLKLATANYVEDLKQGLINAEQNAIENAVALNRLLEDRTKIQKQYAEAERDIRTAGNVTAFRTRAQIAKSEIDKLRKERDEQLEIINKQIELTQFKFDREQEIYALSNDRIANEQRLMQMQKDNIMLDLSRIAALRSVIAELSTKGASITDINAALKTLSMPAALEQTYMLRAQQGLNGYTGL